MKPIATWNSARDVWEKPGTEIIFCGHLAVYSGTFPTSGMTVNGVAYELPTWEPRTDVSGFSSSDDAGTLFLTPVAAEGTKPSNTMGVARRQTTGQAFLTNQIVSLMGLDPSEKILPTPTTSDTNGPGVPGTGGPDLRTAVSLLPTPKASDGEKGGPNQRGSSGDYMLPAISRLLPTPKAGDADFGSPMTSGRPVEKSTHLGTIALLQTGNLEHRRTGDHTSPQSAGGKLNSDGQLQGQLSLLDELGPND